MKTKTPSEQDLADALDAYIEQVASNKPQRSDVAQSAWVADVLREDAEATHADPAFVAKLSAQLRTAHADRTASLWQRAIQSLKLLFKPTKGRTMTRLTWGLTVLCTVIVTLLTLLLLQPRTLPAQHILAQAAEATLREAGQVEHIVVETRLKDIAQNEETAYISEDWSAIGTTMDGYLITVERTTARYAAEDVALAQPVSWSYESWAKSCFLDLQSYPTIYYDPGADPEGCVNVEQTARLSIPSPVGQPVQASPQTWVSRLQVDMEDLIYQEDHFNHRPVYSLTDVYEDTTLTLYIDRETYRPLGFVAQTPNYVLTQTVLHYTVQSRDALPFDPFTWPPAPFAEDFQALPRK